LKVRTELLNPAASASEEDFKKNIALANEMSDIIRKNIVQASPSVDGNFREPKPFNQPNYH
jgi:hypothetical protein